LVKEELKLKEKKVRQMLSKVTQSGAVCLKWSDSPQAWE
jgi:hypothetical protein